MVREAGPRIRYLPLNAGGRFAINAATGVVTVANGSLFVLHRLFEMAGEHAALRVAIEQRLGRVEHKLDTLLREMRERNAPGR